jgi:hypothetical protein
MPVHDWTRVEAGIFHHFHGAWIQEIAQMLNAGALPPDYYALAEQIAGDLGPDVLTLQSLGGNGVPSGRGETGSDRGPILTTVTPPRVRIVEVSDDDPYVARKRSVVVRHVSGDRVVAIVEVVSPGNKSSAHAIRAIVEKAVAALTRGFHLLVIDLFPAGPRDPQGLHGLIWSHFSDRDHIAPEDQPLTLAAYSAGPVVTAYVEPFAVGDALADMPLFLAPESYVTIPLEATYSLGWDRLPGRWRGVLEPG